MHYTVLVSAFILIPLVFSESFYDPFIPIKNQILAVLVGIAIILLIITKKGKDFRSLGSWELSLLFFCHVTSLLVHSFIPSTVNSFGPLYQVSVIVCIGLIVSESLGKNFEFLRLLGLVTIPPFIIVAIIGIIQTMGMSILSIPQGKGPTSTLSNVNMVSQYLGFAIPLILFSEKKVKIKSTPLLRYLVYTSVSFGFALIFLNLTRSVILGLCAYFLVFAVYGKTRRLMLCYSLLLSGFIIVLVNIANQSIITSPENPINKIAIENPKKYESVAKVSNKISDSNGRVDIWKNTLKLIIDHPFGVGPGGFEIKFADYNLTSAGQITKETVLFTTPHNEILRLIAENGVLLGFLIIMIIIKMFWDTWKRIVTLDSSIKLLFLGLISVMVFEILFQFPLVLPIGKMFFGILLGVCFYFSNVKIKKNSLFKSLPRYW